MTTTMEPNRAVVAAPATEALRTPIEKVSIIISKGSLDGVYPGLIMANGARMEGIEANVFFTFFGMDAIHRERNIDPVVDDERHPRGPTQRAQLPRLLDHGPGGARFFPVLHHGHAGPERLGHDPGGGSPA